MAPGFVVVVSLFAGVAPLALAGPTEGRLETSTVALSGAGAAPLRTAGAAADSPAARTSGPADDRWSASVDLVDGTQMVAFSWDAKPSVGADAGALQVRSREGSRWSPWRAVEEDSDEGPDTTPDGAGVRSGIGPIWLGTNGADSLEVRVISGTLDRLELRRMRWIEPRSGAFGAAPADAEPAGPGIAGRELWAPGGWRSDRADCGASPDVMEQMRFAVVHHTVNANDYTASQVPGILAAIYDFHTNGRGWCDIAYNFLIDRFGRVWQGRSGNIATAVLGGHAKGFNTDSMGVALLGQYEPGASPPAVPPSDAEMRSLRDLLAWKLDIHGVDPRGTVTVESQGSTRYRAGTRVTIPSIVGHRDVSLTDCPGDYLQDRLPTLRADVGNAIAAARSPGSWRPFTSPGAVAVRQYQDFLGRGLTNTDQAAWASAMQRDGVDPAVLISRLLTSPEFDQRFAPVPRLYLAAFQRVPDHAGLTYWTGKFRTGTDLDAIATAFAGSSEFRHTYGRLDNAGYVNRIYQNVLGRDPDQAGLRYWLAELDSGRRTRGMVLAGFSASEEYRIRVRLDVYVIATSEALFGRSVTDAGSRSWLASLAAGATVTDMIAMYYRSAEYANRVS